LGGLLEKTSISIATEAHHQGPEHFKRICFIYQSVHWLPFYLFIFKQKKVSPLETSNKQIDEGTQKKLFLWICKQESHIALKGKKQLL